MIRHFVKLFMVAGYAAMIIITGACRSSQVSVDSKDLSYLYNPTKNPINPRYSISNLSADKAEFRSKVFLFRSLLF